MAIETSSDPDAFAAFEHDGWQSVSQGYRRHFTDLTRQTAETTLDAAGVASGTRLLDVCTGPGILAAAAAGRGASALGLDFAAEAVTLARRAVPGAEFVEGDAAALPFADASFDAVTCGYGLMHLPDPARALSEMRRGLRPGGRMAVSVWDAPGQGNGSD
jgi:ubiquinone/menaquinone biosynthesis C-methylase UbiE